MSYRIDTRRSKDWRTLRFESIDDCAAEVRRIMAADHEGRLRASGNWSPGQIIAHVAAWIEYAYDGYPMRRPPFLVRWILRLRFRNMLKNGMARGIRIPGVKEGTYGTDDIPTSDAGERLLAALSKLADVQAANHDSPAYGPMPYEERVELNLRHAELHLGFLKY